MRSNELRRQALNGVGAGLVHRLAAGHVFADLVVGHRREPDLGDGPVAHASAWPASGCRCPVITSCRRSCSRAQHAHGVGGVGGLAQNLAVDHHDGIGAEHDVAGCRQPPPSPSPRQPAARIPPEFPRRVSVSSTSAALTTKGIPALRNSSLRRGDREASNNIHPHATMSNQANMERASRLLGKMKIPPRDVLRRRTGARGVAAWRWERRSPRTRTPPRWCGPA